MRSRRPVRPKASWLVALALVLAGCGSVFGLDDYEITNDERCGDELVNLSSDPDHCGSCDTACRSHEECIGGLCLCETGAEACSGSCVDLDTDEKHCGHCDTECPDDATCKTGACRCDDTDLELCSGACVDLTRDADHCGDCGTACASGASCDNGTCVCDDADLDICSGRCVDVATDEANCGRCGNACPTGATCTGGDCECPSGEEVCGDVCADLSDDPDHCGTCANDCNVAHASSTCRNGACVGSKCDAGYGDCNGDLSTGERGNGCEVNTNTSALNCGGCNVACDADEQCTAGDCSCMVPGGSGECSPSGCGCGTTEGCYYSSDSTSWICVTAGSVGEGGACDDNADCAADLSCVSDICRSYCGQGQPCTGDCSPVYVDDVAVSDWNYCHEVCNPIPTSTLYSAPACGSGQRCTLLFAGSSVCGAVNSNAGTRGSRCASNEDCQTGGYCNATGHCAAFCWVESDTCTLFGAGLGCRTYVDPILIDDNEVGECLPTQAAAGCKESCVTDADCSITGTRCVDTTSGNICLNEQCMDCFNQDMSCTSDNDTCEFLQCVP